MAVLISFWKPVNIFSGKFNEFAAWVTGGEYCHSDICLHVDPSVLTSSLTKAMALRNDDCNLAIEESFFADPVARQKLNSPEKIFVSFSALWGMKLSARVLRNTATSAWEHTPLYDHADVEWLEVKGIEDEDIQKVSDYCVAQLGKQYATYSAILSASGTDCSLFHDESKKFCSELCIDALHEAGVMETLNGFSVTPNKLFGHVEKWNKIYEKEWEKAMGNDEVESPVSAHSADIAGL